MFTSWFEIFKEQSLIKKILARYQEMIESARWMFEKMGIALLEGRDPQQWAQELKERDKALNQTERDVRKLIVEHLAINPARDLGASLVFFSGVKDAERLGDYCKNLLEVAETQDGKPFPESHNLRVRDLFRTTERQFDKAALAFADWDEERARAIMDEIYLVMKECRKILLEMMQDSNSLPVKDAVTIALTVRYLERIAGHISNIASGIVNPVHKIDYYKPKH